jgi:heme/copper-type cytochrome/quinol oxidase subunit 2
MTDEEYYYQQIGGGIAQLLLCLILGYTAWCLLKYRNYKKIGDTDNAHKALRRLGIFWICIVLFFTILTILV